VQEKDEKVKVALSRKDVKNIWTGYQYIIFGDHHNIEIETR